jgi:hypothetical protein
MKTTPTVHELRKLGLKVRVSHYRLFYRFCEWTGIRLEKVCYGNRYQDTLGEWMLSPRGGKTEVLITDKEGVDYYGDAYCSKKDSYVKAFGRKKALLRAYAQYHQVHNV